MPIKTRNMLPVNLFLKRIAQMKHSWILFSWFLMKWLTYEWLDLVPMAASAC